MKEIRIYSLLLLILVCTGCSIKSWQLVSATSERIPVDAHTQHLADTSYLKMLQPLKLQIDAKMNVVIGHTAVTMKAHKPESLLSNFSADVYREAGADYLKQPVDIAIVNLGGLRTVVPAGTITLEKVFELMPFNNELVLLWLRGDKLMELLNYFALNGGEGVSGIRMQIREDKPVNVTINGESLNVQKLYVIATNDYLAGGNDKMFQLAMYERRLNTGIKVREMLIKYITNQNKEGKDIHPILDGRISIIK